MDKLADHYILCGYSEMGHSIGNELLSTEKDFVIIDENPDIVNELIHKDLLAIEGDDISDKLLERAGIKNPKSLISTIDTDAENVYITLTTRVSNPDSSEVVYAQDCLITLDKSKNLNKLQKFAHN